MPPKSDVKMEEPSDEMLIDAIKAIRIENPKMGREKLQMKLRREHKNWEFTGTRLKKTLLEHHLDTEETQKLREEVRFRPTDTAYKYVVRPAFEMYRERERSFFLTLSKDDRCLLDLRRDKPISEAHFKLLERKNGKHFSVNDPRLPLLMKRPKNPRPEWYFAAHYRFHVQVLMVLLNVKKVALFSHPEFKGITVLERMVDQCLKPVIKKFKLDQYGFVLQKIEQPMRTEGGSSFQGAMVFTNKRDIDRNVNEDIETVFFTLKPGKVFSEASLARVLGYPMAGTPGKNPVRYRDITEMAWLWNTIDRTSKNISSQFFVPALDYACGQSPEHFKYSMEHFEIWNKAAKSVGVTLMHDSKANPAFEAWKKASKMKK